MTIEPLGERDPADDASKRIKDPMPRASTRVTKPVNSHVFRACVLLGLALLALAVAQHQTWLPGLEHDQHGTDDGRMRELSPTGRFLLGDYGEPILRVGDPGAPPVIDVGATITALVGGRINTYAYLICPDEHADPRVSRSQWDQLPDFARQAEAAGIDVLVYLVPPTEAAEAAYEPFNWDYVSWFDHIGRLARQERSIKGIVMDDFGGNVTSRPSLGFHFSEPYVAQMTAAARHHVPTLSFLPILYHHDMVGPNAILSEFRAHMQGVIFPYFGYSDGTQIRGNTRDATLALTQGVEVSDLLGCPADGACRQVVFPKRSGLEDGEDIASWTSRVVPLPNQRRVVTFSVLDDGGSLERSSYRIEIVVGGTTVGTVNRGRGWNDRIFDITAATANTPTAEIGLRIVRPTPVAKNRITVQLGLISVRGMTADDGFAAAPQTTSDVASAPIEDIPLIFMPYAKALSAEQGRGASPVYLEAVLRQVDVLRGQGRIAGSLVFKLPLVGSVLDPAPGEHYQIVARRYAEWSPR